MRGASRKPEPGLEPSCGLREADTAPFAVKTDPTHAPTDHEKAHAAAPTPYPASTDTGRHAGVRFDLARTTQAD